LRNAAAIGLGCRQLEMIKRSVLRPSNPQPQCPSLPVRAKSNILCGDRVLIRAMPLRQGWGAKNYTVCVAMTPRLLMMGLHITPVPSCHVCLLEARITIEALLHMSVQVPESVSWQRGIEWVLLRAPLLQRVDGTRPGVGQGRQQARTMGAMRRLAQRTAARKMGEDLMSTSRCARRGHTRTVWGSQGVLCC
jgi:hypothetical protein